MLISELYNYLLAAMLGFGTDDFFSVSLAEGKLVESFFFVNKTDFFSVPLAVELDEGLFSRSLCLELLLPPSKFSVIAASLLLELEDCF